VRVGDYVLAIGNPLGLGQTVTMGIVSAKNRMLGGKITQYEDFIQTDAAINQGNSGGPLFNFKGEVIGINSAILNPAVAMNIGFAIPINLARQISDQIQRSGSVARGYLGVGTEDMTPDKAKRLGLGFELGALVNVVNPGSPAATAGLRSNDIITEVAGRRIENSAGLQHIIQSRAPGESVELAYVRAGRRATAKVQIAGNAALMGANILGMQLVPLTQSEIAEMGMPGLKVVSIDRRSPASGYLQAGDVITHVVLGQQAKAATAALLKQLEQKLGHGGGGRLVIVRDGYQLVLNLG
jgi:S1-C subfamily serine protease